MGSLEVVAIPEVQHVEVKTVTEMVIISASIPASYYDIIQKMVEIEKGSVPDWISHEIKGSVESYLNSDCYGSMLNDQWKAIIEK